MATKTRDGRRLADADEELLAACQALVDAESSGYSQHCRYCNESIDGEIVRHSAHCPIGLAESAIAKAAGEPN